jgi:hypothetical protein
MVKHYLMEYCEATCPGDYDAQDELFEQIVSGEVKVSLEEMKVVVDRYRGRDHVQEIPKNPPPSVESGPQ